jgi:hypothetical protein
MAAVKATIVVHLLSLLQLLIISVVGSPIQSDGAAVKIAHDAATTPTLPGIATPTEFIIKLVTDTSVLIAGEPFDVFDHDKTTLSIATTIRGASKLGVAVEVPSATIFNQPMQTTVDFIKRSETTPLKNFIDSPMHGRNTCTTSVSRILPFTQGPVSTQFASTTTTTSILQCNNCSLSVVNIGGHGPVVLYTTTVTVAAVKTIQAFACQTTDFQPDSATSA